MKEKIIPEILLTEIELSVNKISETKISCIFSISRSIGIVLNKFHIVMLPLKEGLCPLCEDGKEKRLISGLCQIHYWGGLRGQSAPLSRKAGISRHLIQKDEADDQKLEVWYDRHIKEVSWCWECTLPIIAVNRKIAKAAVAHIFAKELFPSIQTHDLNYMILGAGCGCHTQWDKYWASAARMKVFAIALERFPLLYLDIALAERRRIPEIFMNTLNAV